MDSVDLDIRKARLDLQYAKRTGTVLFPRNLEFNVKCEWRTNTVIKHTHHGIVREYVRTRV